VKERDIQKAILDWLFVKRVYALRLNTGSGWANGRLVEHHSGGKGVADIIAFPRFTRTQPGMQIKFDRPTVLWIEVKSPTGQQSQEQKSFEEHCAKYGMFYLLARSVDDVEFWFKERCQ